MIHAQDRDSVVHWRLDAQFDVPALQAEVAALDPACWQVHFNTGYHDGGWSGVALLSADGDPNRLYPGHLALGAGRPTPVLDRCPALARVLAGWPWQVQSARLLRLAPGSRIQEHADDGIGLAAGTVRLHIPIVSGPGVEFYVYGTRVPMAEGECWYLDLGLPHRVQNNGSETRVHLVLDCTVDDDFCSRLPTADESRKQLRTILEAQGPGQETTQLRCEGFLLQVLNSDDWPSEWADAEDPFSLAIAVQAEGARRGHDFAVEDVLALHKSAKRRWIEGRLVGMPVAKAVRASITSTTADTVRLRGWTPMLAEVEGGELTVELCRTGEDALLEPFFEDSVAAALRRPAVALLRQRVAEPVLAQALVRQPGLPLGGLVFHLSRCGSTLVSQVLASSARHRVLSEPAPLDAVLNAGPSPLGCGTRGAWVRSMVGALSQPARASEERSFIKLDSWHALQIDFVCMLFPEAPWVFLMRDPVEVIVSQLRHAGAQMVPGMVVRTFPPGMTLADAVQMPREVYFARVLGALCEAVLQHWDRDPGRGLLVDYSTLRDDLDARCLPHLGVDWCDGEREAAAAVRLRNAKRPEMPYESDVVAKQAEAGDAVREAARRWVMPAYQALRERAGLPPAQTA